MVDKKNTLARAGMIGLAGLLSGCVVGAYRAGPNGAVGVGIDLTGPLMAEAEQHNRQMARLHAGEPGYGPASIATPPPQREPEVLDSLGRLRPEIYQKAELNGVYVAFWQDNGNGKIDGEDIIIEQDNLRTGTNALIVYKVPQGGAAKIYWVNKKTKIYMNVAQQSWPPQLPVSMQGITVYGVKTVFLKQEIDKSTGQLFVGTLECRVWNVDQNENSLGFVDLSLICGGNK